VLIHRLFTRALAVSAVAAMGAAGLASAAATPAAARATKVALPFDFNGDGYQDLALGSPYGTVSGKKSAGFVTIVYGSASGPNTKKKQVFSQNTSGVPGVAETGDHFGYSVTSFDYDKDGYADLLIGAPDEDTSAGTDAGSETILWGGPSGLTGSGADTMGEPSGYAGAHHRFGFALAAADIDQDGWTDWVDTSPGDRYFWTFTSRPSTAAAVRTTSAVHSSAFHPSGKGRPFKGTRKGVAAAATTGLSSLVPAFGDVDGDGTPDLVLSWQDPSATGAGRSGFDVWTASATDTPTSAVSTTVNGLAVGDFDGDGKADVAVGGADESDGTGGHVRVFKGSADAAMSSSYRITQDTSGVPGAGVSGDEFGYSLSAGDINKDGKADLAVGVPGRKVSGHATAGEAVLLYGSANGLTGAGSQAVSQDTSGVPGAAEAGDRFGWQVSLLDVRHDGFADLIAGAPKENGTDGAVSVLNGLAGGVTGTGSATFGASTVGVHGIDAQIGVRIGRSA
jgi:hypothetical protein